jgi:hypothetical protein
MLSPVASFAAAIPSKAEASPTRDADLAQIRDVLARQEVARALADRGLASEEVEERLARLSDEDLRALAGNVEQIQAAGAVPEYIWILLGVFLAVSILVMVF